MAFLMSSIRSFSRRNLCGLMLLMAAVSVSAQPSQKPLLNRDGGGVNPNLIVTLDTSASMDFQHAPEFDFKIATSASAADDVTVTFPNFSYYWMHPYDPGPGYYDGSFKGTVPANPYRGTTAASMLFQMQMRSPDLNTIYYNPELRYDRWIKADGSRMAASPPAAAPYIPMMPALSRTDGQSVTANLTETPLRVDANASVSGLATGVSTTASLLKTVKWCGRYTASTNTPICTTTAEDYYPMIYYRLNKDASGTYYKDPTNFKNYSFVDINGMKSGYSKKDTANNSWQKSSTDTSTGTVTLTSFPKYPARIDCISSATSCSQAEEQQNFANWFTYYRSRMLLAQGSIPEAFKDIGATLRLGWGRIHKTTAASVDGVNTTIVDSGVRDFSAVTDKSTSSTRARFINWLRNHPGNTDPDTAVDFTTVGGTPLLEAVTGVGEYYKRTDNGGPWSDNPAGRDTAAHKTCRRAYNMLVTDGYYSDPAATWTKVKNVDGTNGAAIADYQYLPVAPYADSNSNTLADVAMKYWVEDLRPGLDNKVVATAGDPAYWQHMTNYMIGLGVNGTLDRVKDWPLLKAGTQSWPVATGAGRIDDLWHAAVNSRGEYYSVKTPKELTEGIKEALGSTLQKELREAGVATASTTLQKDNRKYVPIYQTGSWGGDVQAYLLDDAGQAGALQWSALAVLPPHGSRNIVTWSTDVSPAAAVAFTSSAMGTSNLSSLGSLTTTPTSTVDDLVNFLRGDDTNKGDGKAFRDRSKKLGDFINSNPVLVKGSVNLGYGSLPDGQGGGGTNYSAFVAAKAARTATVFVGSNDGMLHAFKDTLGKVPATDGEEVFAFVPKTVIPNLSKLADKTYGTSLLYHQFYVDGPLMETDAYINAPGASAASWRNYLLGSLGNGGRAVFALDVTSAPSLTATNVRWELSGSTQPDLGYVTSPIEAGVLPNGEWVAVFGNGRFSTNGKATLFVVNLQTGVAKTLDVDATGSNGLSGVGVVRNSIGQITNLYAGDLKGKLWKFNYLASATSRFEIDGAAAFFSATHTNGTAQPIIQAPVIFEHSKGGKMVVFGTGALSTEEEANDTTSTQAIYGVWDKVGDTGRPMSRTLLETRTLSAVLDGAFFSLSGDAVSWDGVKRGWVINLDTYKGLRVIYPSQKVSSKIALISVVQPASTVVACEAVAGSGFNLLIPVEQGLNPTYRLFDTDGEGGINSSDAAVVGYKTGADGIDAIVKSSPVCSAGICKTTISLQNPTGQRTAVLEDPDESFGSSRSIKDRIWRRIINPPIR